MCEMVETKALQKERGGVSDEDVDQDDHAFLTRIRDRAVSGLAYEAGIEQTLDELADHLEEHVKLERLLEVARAS